MVYKIKSILFMGLRLIRCLKFLLLFVVLITGLKSGEVLAQTSVQEALSQQNLTLQQAQNLARQAGINPNNPAELTRFAKANGVSDQQIQQWLSEMGMNSSAEVPSGEVQDLRDMTISEDEVVESDQFQISTPEIIANVDTIPEKKENGLPYYGYSIFNNVPEAFLPNAVGPVDDGYLIGPNDELRLTVWGVTEFQYELEVDAQGRIFIPTLGQITVAGQTLKDFREQLKLRLSKSYSGFAKNPPTMFLDVTLTRLRPIRVFVIGEVENPGGYTFSSYSTMFNVLYGIGGPTTNGSLRDIQLIRNGEVITHFDLYDFLMDGIDSGSTKIQNNDRIFIPKRKNSIYLSGPVLRPAIYELKEGEGLEELINYSGGLKSQAYGKRFNVERIVPLRERTDPSIARKVIDYNLIEVLDGLNTYVPQDDDKIAISTISDRVENVAFIEGAVYQPGQYEINQELRTVKDLVIAADSLKGEAILYQAELIRTNEDLTQTFYSIEIDRALNNESAHNLTLQRLDRLRIISRTDLEDTYTVSITGSIDEDVTIPWRDSLTVYDLLFKGKGLFDPQKRESIYLKRADLIRQNEDERSSTVIPFNLGEALTGNGFGKEVIEPYDQIRVYSNTTELIDNKFVIIEGEVKRPGRYELNDNMTLEDVLIVAGGFTEASYLGKVEVARLTKPDYLSSKAIQFFWPILDGEDGDKYYSSELADSLFELASKYQVQHRDRIYVRSNPFFETQKTVMISGEVLYPGEYTILNENETISNILSRAGGITPEGYSKGARYYRDGKLLLLDLDKIIEGRQKSNIQILPGDELVIPQNPSTVLVEGNVGLESLIKHLPGEKLTYYLDRAGGMQKDSYKYVLLKQANGMNFQVKRKGLFKGNPIVEAGATISVIYEEPKPRGEKMNTGEILQTAIATLTSALTIIVLVDRVFQ